MKIVFYAHYATYFRCANYAKLCCDMQMINSAGPDYREGFQLQNDTKHDNISYGSSMFGVNICVMTHIFMQDAAKQ